MYRPFVIDADGEHKGVFRVTSGPIRVGEATEPYHAVPLSQVKRLLKQLAALGGNPVLTDSFGKFSDRVVGYILSEIGWHEALDYVYAGRVGSSASWSAGAVMPLAVIVFTDTILACDIAAGYPLSEALGENLDYVYTGHIVDNVMSYSDNAVLPSALNIVSETITFGDSFTPYVLGDAVAEGTSNDLGYVFTGHIVDVGMVYKAAGVIAAFSKFVEPVSFKDIFTPYTLSDAVPQGVSDNLGYVITALGYNTINMSDTAFSLELIYTVDTITITDSRSGDLIFAETPITVDEYPLDGYVLQKTKPNPTGESKRMSDRAYGVVEPKLNS
jgi:hypothetical protein